MTRASHPGPIAVATSSNPRLEISSLKLTKAASTLSGHDVFARRSDSFGG
jgi:hypothetical protein